MEDKNNKYEFNDLDKEYCIIEIETSGLSSTKDEIIEIGIMRIKNGKQMDRFISLIKPEKELNENISEITNITNEMLRDAPTFEEILPQILDFIENDTIIFYNARFNGEFLKESYKKCNIEFKNPYIDLLKIVKEKYPILENYKLNTVADYLEIIRSENLKNSMIENLLLLKHVFKVVAEEIRNEN